MTAIFTRQELKEIIATLKSAYLKVAASGGVTSYTLNSGQGSTTVHSASLDDITKQLKFYGEMLSELEEVETGANISYFGELGF